MTITDGTITAETADEIVAYGRELYRRVQQIDWPQDAIEALRHASSRLWTETEVCARVRADGMAVTPGRLARAREAAGNLIQAVHASCGGETAAAVAGEAAP